MLWTANHADAHRDLLVLWFFTHKIELPLKHLVEFFGSERSFDLGIPSLRGWWCRSGVSQRLWVLGLPRGGRWVEG
jgi:hypothetical protein